MGYTEDDAVRNGATKILNILRHLEEDIQAQKEELKPEEIHSDDPFNSVRAAPAFVLSSQSRFSRLDQAHCQFVHYIGTG